MDDVQEARPSQPAVARRRSKQKCTASQKMKEAEQQHSGESFTPSRFPIERRCGIG